MGHDVSRALFDSGSDFRKASYASLQLTRRRQRTGTSKREWVSVPTPAAKLYAFRPRTASATDVAG